MFKNNLILRVSLVISLAFMVFGIIFRDWLEKAAPAFLSFNVNYFGPIYLVVTLLIVIVSVYLMFSKYGTIKLGKDSDKPEFSTISWISMLFAAGMGIGLVFWATAEPITHYISPPVGEGSTSESAELSIKYTFFHWGLHPWALFGLVGLGMAYFQFRKKLPARVSSIFYPVLGDRIYGPWGKTIDIYAIFITVIGIAQAFGLGAIQISEGANFLWGFSNTTTVSMFIIVFGTVLFMISALTGVNRGIKYLSNFNMLLAFVLMMFIFFIGPTKQIIDIFITGTGSYISDIVAMSSQLAPFNGDQQNWVSNWTIFYLAWWLTWASFVGAFISRISKGRTIREFVMAVLFLPSILCFIWFSIFGGAGIHLIHDLGNSMLGEAVNTDVTQALFSFLEYFPMSSLTSALMMLLCLVFFITSADSGTYVLAMFSSGGNINPDNKIKFIWGLIIFSISAVFIIAGGLETIKTVVIVVSTPFIIFMLCMTYTILKALRSEFKKPEEKEDIKSKTG
ncbi:BCCT family transporter [Oceanobacillus timonensis]|uniref:BCCT family transporter n=1 Tax=Oceanobacillus timonensis TaxID=1926285 RepID=UPI0009BBF6A3|nr:BCCT family transporter [Oceanobacillus timonensis]